MVANKDTDKTARNVRSVNYEGMIIVESLSFLCSSLLSYKDGSGDKQSLAKGGICAISIIFGKWIKRLDSTFIDYK